MEKAAMIDLEDFDTRPASEEGRWLQLKHPETGKLLPAKLLLQGVDSQAWKDCHLEQRRARLEAMEQSGTTRVDPAHLDAEDLARLVAVTKGWDGIAKGKKPLAHSPAAVSELYLGWPEFRTQALMFVTGRANFLPGSATGS